MQTTKALFSIASLFVQLGLFLLLLKCTNAAIADSFPTKDVASNKDAADKIFSTGVKIDSPQTSSSKMDIFEAEEDSQWGEDELVWGSEEFLNQQNMISCFSSSADARPRFALAHLDPTWKSTESEFQ